MNSVILKESERLNFPLNFLFGISTDCEAACAKTHTKKFVWQNLLNWGEGWKSSEGELLWSDETKIELSGYSNTND